MLARKYRATRKDIENAIKGGFTVDSGILYAKISRKDTEKAGFAIVVSKKVEKTSVGRHLIKRRVSDVLEKNLSKLGSNFKKTVVFFAKKQEKVPEYAEIKKGVEEILLKVF
ncbi:MAG: ribonuclease P protein component [Candidatus Paceibacterota bacterium]|jgi:ribonuclease P protein component